MPTARPRAGHVLIYRSEGCAHMSARAAPSSTGTAPNASAAAPLRRRRRHQGARRVVGAEDIAALLPPAFPDTLAGVGLLPGGSARRRPAQLGGATAMALDLELERARSRALQQELTGACQIATNRRNRRGRPAVAVSPAAGPTPPPVFAPALADSGLVVSNPAAAASAAGATPATVQAWPRPLRARERRRSGAELTPN